MTEDPATAVERFADEHAKERDPERKEVLAAIVRLLRHEPLRLPETANPGTVKSLATEAGIDRFHFASAARGRHYALARRFLAAAQEPDATPPTEARLRQEKQDLARRVQALSHDLATERRTVELLARSNRVLNAEIARLQAEAQRGNGGLRAVPQRTGR